MPISSVKRRRQKRRLKRFTNKKKAPILKAVPTQKKCDINTVASSAIESDTAKPCFAKIDNIVKNLDHFSTMLN